MTQHSFGGNEMVSPGAPGVARTRGASAPAQAHSRAAEQGDRPALRLAAILLLGGEVLSAVAGVLHPAREAPNNHAAVFAEYAQSSSWIAVHLGQFVGMAVIVAGLIALFHGLNVSAGRARGLAAGAAATALVSLALYGVLQAVDGVALKHAVDAWAAAPAAEKAARFASAETMRWLEWAARAYHAFVLGLALLLYAGAIMGTGRLPRGLGAVLGLCGLAYWVQGWVVSVEGFSPTNSLPTLLTIVLFLAGSLWLLIWLLRGKDTRAILPS
jgi:hypothetical protein